MSSSRISRPRYLNSAIEKQYGPVLFGTQGGIDEFFDSYFSWLTRRHIAAAGTRDPPPAPISNWPPYATSCLAQEVDPGHHVKRPFDKRFWTSQYPWPS